jgi:hypothetical protein
MQRAVGNRAVARLLAGQRVEGGSAASGSGPKLQRQLVQTDGNFTDTRDVTQPPVVFEPLGNDSYKVLDQVVVYGTTHQFVRADGWCFDPYSRQWYQYSNDRGLYACWGQWYWYDGTYYQPYVQPQTTTTPQTSSPSSQSTGQTRVPTSSYLSVPSQSSGKMSNADFSKLVSSRSTKQASLSSQLASMTRLSDCIKLLRGWGDRNEALALVRSSSHGRGFKGLEQRIEDRRLFSSTHHGHRWAEYNTYWLYVELLKALGISVEYDLLADTCRDYGFDKKPPDKDPEGGGGGGLGSATRRQKQRLNIY